MEHDKNQDLTIVGAGIAGLSLARQLQRQGSRVRLIEKAAGVGGRCATRRIEGQPVDHGVPLLHGVSQPFISALAEMQTCPKIEDWPFHLRGSGTPCQPQAYNSQTKRVVFQQGVSQFPKHLAHCLELDLNTNVQGIEFGGDHFRLTLESGQIATPQQLVLTCPVNQAVALLQPLATDCRELQGLLKLLGQPFTLPCLTVIARYGEETAGQHWHLHLPGPQNPIHSLINDSSKRAPGAIQTLVIQANPRFSKDNLVATPEQWTKQLLAAASELVGPWAASPALVQSHTWRFARVQRGQELSHPPLFRWSSGAVLGLCGEAFNPLGGVEGAFLSGLELAHRLRHELATEL